MNTKIRQAIEHLSKGCRVKLEMKLKGRQNAHPDVALEKMDSMITLLKAPRIVVEKEATLSGRTIEALFVMKENP